MNVSFWNRGVKIGFLIVLSGISACRDVAAGKKAAQDLSPVTDVVQPMAVQITLTAAPDPVTWLGEADFTFAWSSTEVTSLAGIECQLDKGDWRECTQGFTESWLRLGAHHLLARPVTGGSASSTLTGTVEYDWEIRSLFKAKRLAFNYSAGCIITVGGNLWCWGNNYSGLIAGRNNAREDNAVLVSDRSDWILVGVGAMSACAITKAMRLFCWGSRPSLLAQETNPMNWWEAIDYPVKGGDIWKDVAASRSSICGLKNDNTVWCWGITYNGQLGLGQEVSGTIEEPTKLDLADIMEIGSNEGGYCGLSTAHKLYCWGELYRLGGPNDSGVQTILYYKPEMIADNVLLLASNGGSGSHYCYISTGQDLFCFGDNTYGNLGNGSTSPATTTTYIKHLSSGSHVYLGYWITSIVDADGLVEISGNNSYYGYGDGTTDSSTVFRAIEGNARWQNYSALGFEGCGIDSNSDVLCWGSSPENSLLTYAGPGLHSLPVVLQPAEGELYFKE